MSITTSPKTHSMVMAMQFAHTASNGTLVSCLTAPLWKDDHLLARFLCTRFSLLLDVRLKLAVTFAVSNCHCSYLKAIWPSLSAFQWEKVSAEAERKPLDLPDRSGHGWAEKQPQCKINSLPLTLIGPPLRDVQREPEHCSFFGHLYDSIIQCIFYRLLWHRSTRWCLVGRCMP